MSDPASFDETARQLQHVARSATAFSPPNLESASDPAEMARAATQKRWGLRVLEALAMVAFVSAFYPW